MSTQQEAPQDRIFTVPNTLSLARLVGVPLFLWLVLIEADWWAIGVLVVAGLSDWLDGKLARALNQMSKLGAVLDPAADRLYILATLIGLTIRDIIPVWLVVALVAREFAILPIAPIVRRLGYSGTLPVHFIGKAATLCLLYAFPLLLLGDHDGAAATAAKVTGWSFAIWGTALYWWAAVLYWAQTRQLALAGRISSPASGPDPAPGRGRPGDPGAEPPAGDQKGAETPR
ncbi:CDP-alcohol phosphatidyltransferase family protein [Actinomadura sp. 7K507]|uniref:CDP-alcohol phosphatidyltransferase family protein n=1 Tax=Actinomadura sp. 7K507 TaxID=2530365 RepID=UPI00104E6C9B|nr:CDP-alcohol phosphatidyltransferase family protein [Actinomadura sp. 7K507]TDC95270.1 CDP-alcohol phosphatidyltransferase family protein [Actinomadura sp. 7K507]